MENKENNEEIDFGGMNDLEIEGGFDFFDENEEESDQTSENSIKDTKTVINDDNILFSDGGGELPEEFKSEFEKPAEAKEIDQEALEVAKSLDEEVNKKQEQLNQQAFKAEGPFAEDVKAGLTAPIKHIDSKYFYDEEGSKLFEAIMKMPEYYLTDAEYEIINTKKSEILTIFESAGPFNLIELGPGNGLKTKVMLEHFMHANTQFTYFPVDISWDAMLKFERELNDEFPMLPINPINADYTKALSILGQEQSPDRNVVMFMGSNIGNFTPKKATEFLTQIGKNLQSNDLMLIGFDLKKAPSMISKAYNDPHGITRQFNMNLLTRINRECGAKFDLNTFEHHMSYDPFTGSTRSYLVSTKKQSVDLPGLRMWARFEYGEPILTEISQKYDKRMIEKLALESGFKASDFFYDCKNYFTDAVFVKV